MAQRRLASGTSIRAALATSGCARRSRRPAGRRARDTAGHSGAVKRGSACSYISPGVDAAHFERLVEHLAARRRLGPAGDDDVAAAVLR